MLGESGEAASEELELGQRLWLRLEEVGVTGRLDAPEEWRECAGVRCKGESHAISFSLCLMTGIFGKEKERILSILYLPIAARL